MKQQLGIFEEFAAVFGDITGHGVDPLFEFTADAFSTLFDRHQTFVGTALVVVAAACAAARDVTRTAVETQLLVFASFVRAFVGAHQAQLRAHVLQPIELQVIGKWPGIASKAKLLFQKGR